MLISKFPAASGATFPVGPCALALTETRLPKVGVGAPRAGAQGYTPACHLHRSKNGCAPARVGGAGSGNTERNAARAKRAAAGRRDLLRVQPVTV